MDGKIVDNFHWAAVNFFNACWWVGGMVFGSWDGAFTLVLGWISGMILLGYNCLKAYKLFLEIQEKKRQKDGRDSGKNS